MERILSWLPGNALNGAVTGIVLGRLSKIIATLLVAAGSTAWMPAQAVVITINADAYLIGANVSRPVPGVKLSQLEQPQGVVDPESGTVVAAEIARSGAVAIPFERNQPEYGDVAFGRGYFLGEYSQCLTSGICGESNLFGFAALEIVFDAPTDFIQAGFGFYHDGALLMAFDAQGHLLQTCHSFGSGAMGCDSVVDRPNYSLDDEGTVSFVSYSRPQADIARVLLGGSDIIAEVFQVSFNDRGRSVPEPGPAGLFALGLLGVSLRLRRSAH